MKRFLLSLLVLVSMSPAFSQRNYFVYIQAENDQPFFVKMDEKLYSSSANGYLILSRLRDSSYALTFGFPQNKYPEQKVTIELQGRDRGYLFKNFGEKGWGLFDLQTLSVIMASPAEATSRIDPPAVPDENVSLFTAMLARAANDPSIKDRPAMVKKADDVAIQPAVVRETIVQPPVVEEKKHEPVIAKTEPVKTETNEPAPKPSEQQLIIEIEAPAIVKVGKPVVEKEEAPGIIEYKRSTVTRRSESSTSAGFGLTFIDEQADGKRDTIRILIPTPRSSRSSLREQEGEAKKFLDISGDTARKVVAADLPRVNDEAAKINKTECSSVATDNDFLALQKKMMAEKGMEDMIDEAKKVFRKKCFSSVQLKTLSVLFSSDNGKYKFFDAAYQYVSDAENFPSLVNELKDEYYVNRFNAMLRKT